MRSTNVRFWPILISRESRRDSVGVTYRVFCSCLALALSCFSAGSMEAASLDDEFVTSKRHWAVTDTKFELSFKRYRLNKNVRHPQPVILIHGLLVNSGFLDFGGASLAEYLAEAGFDVWNLSLRGTGRSLSPLGWGQKPWTLDEILKDDLPTVIGYVKKTTGSANVFLVGYELGGALAFAHVGKNREHGVAGIVGIASPMSFDSPEQDRLDVLVKLDRQPVLRNTLLYANSSGLNRFLFMVPGFEDTFYNPGNMTERVKKELLESLLVSVNPGVLDQLITTVREGRVRLRRRRFQLPRHAVRNSNPGSPDRGRVRPHRTAGSPEEGLLGAWLGGPGPHDLLVGSRRGHQLRPFRPDPREERRGRRLSARPEMARIQKPVPVGES